MLFETIINKGAEPVRLLLVVGIAYTLAMGIWSFFDTPQTMITSPNQNQQTQSNERAPANVNWILAKHLFGEAGAAPVDAEQSNEPAVQTRLPLELHSVFVADEAEASAAIVAQKGKTGKLYAIGDNLPGNAKLVEVLLDRIILRRAGVRETLMFPKIKTQFVADEDNDGPNQDAPANRTAQQAAVPEPAANNAVEEPTEVLETYRDKLADDAQGTLDELGIEVVDDDTAGGYRIGDVAQNPYLRQTGLQPGDVILSVNGRPVGDVQQDQLELENIMAQGSARIEVKRGSRRFFITASLK